MKTTHPGLTATSEENAKATAIAAGLPFLMSATGDRLHFAHCPHLELEPRLATALDVAEHWACWTCTPQFKVSDQVEICHVHFIMIPKSGVCDECIAN